MLLPNRRSSDQVSCETAPTSRLILMTAVWFFSASLGFLGLAFYANSPGEAAVPPARWPEHSQLSLHAEHPTLLFFAHPRCPCTRASAYELETVISRSVSRPSVSAVVALPRESDRAWRDSVLVRKLKQLPRVNLFEDVVAQETRLFGVSTSGHVLLYSPDGQLLFSGGVTGSRGHVGENLGTMTLRRLLSNKSAGIDIVETCRIYGCPLFPLESSDLQEASQ